MRNTTSADPRSETHSSLVPTLQACSFLLFSKVQFAAFFIHNGSSRDYASLVKKLFNEPCESGKLTARAHLQVLVRLMKTAGGSVSGH